MKNVFIKVPITMHRPGKLFAPYNGTAGLGSDALPVVYGNRDDIEIFLPGQPFECTEAEAAYLLKLHGGCIVDPPKPKMEL
jgi:hypothetical protein